MAQVEDVRIKKSSTSSRLGEIFVKLKGIKNIQIIVAILIIAVALIIYSNVIKKSKSNENTSQISNIMTEEEARLSAVLSEIDGAGDVSAMITTKQDGDIVGVIVIAQGASDITVRLKLLDAAATALGVDKSLINVYSKST